MVAMGKMCRTVSLATLQNVFPLEKYWRQHTNTLPTNPSLYVQEYIGLHCLHKILMMCCKFIFD